LRWRLGTFRLAVLREARRPLRLRQPFFSPARECRRIVARQATVVAGGGASLSDWETHEPIVVELLTRNRSARVLELGIGYGSTPLVLHLSGSSVSLETDDDWFRRFARYDRQDHRIVRWRDYSDADWDCPYLAHEWDVALIDNAPAHSRQSNLQKLADRSRFIVCHDTQESFVQSPSDYRWDFSGFEYVWTYTQFDTYTTVVSNREPIPLEHLEGVAEPRGRPLVPRDHSP
jgi:hypothetical protein